MTIRPGPSFRRSTSGLRVWPVLLLAGSLVAVPPVCAAPKKGEESPRISPALDLLPAGSTLKTVSIPRYDENKNPSALLRAGLMKVISKEHVSGQNVELRVYNATGEQRLKVHMGAAEYLVPEGILNGSEVLTLSGKGIKARGTGAVFHLDSRQAFVFGPASTTLSADLNKKLNAMNASSRSITSALLAVANLAVAAPEPVAPADLAIFSQRARPEEDRLLKDIAPTKQAVTRSDQLSGALDLSFRSFVRNIRRPELLAIAVAEPVQPPAPKVDPAGIHITCEGGMFFDIDKGQVVYLKDIVIKHPEFTLNCANELKIFLDQKEAAPGDEKPKGIAAFGDIKNIIATGGVRIVRNNDKGQPLVATADTASHDAKTGDTVLRGGFPMVQQGKNFIRARESGLYIRIYKNGNVFNQPGKWETGISDLEKLKKAE